MLKKILSPIQKHNGFSLVEVAVALGLMAIVGVLVSQLTIGSSKTFTKLNDKIEVQIDKKLGEKILLKDLRVSSPSMNVLYVEDDDKLNFFDYDPDESSVFYKSQTKKSRALTLQKNGKSEFYLLVADESRGKGLFTDVITFFELGPSPASMVQAASLSYRGLNFHNYISKNGPAMAEEGRLIAVDSSSIMPSSNSQKAATFIGRIAGKSSSIDLVKVSFPEKLFNYAIFNTLQAEYIPQSFEDYLINLPPVGANGSSVRLKAVKLIKYKLDCQQTECVLLRYDFSSLREDPEMKVIVLKGFDKITFYRDNTSASVFKVGMGRTK
ncbi:MAG: prepilin-type N-terminal cleavage/methylation domain-containing protein [Bdellovibrio sp.]|nr:prepilin-type N-terminal cleavage/methylation domain-containing protein [Bdellovibrio sp.]